MIPAMAEYPEDAIQRLYSSAGEPWWVQKPKGTQEVVERWDLLVSLVPYLGEVPQRAVLTRLEPTQHTRLEAKVAPFHIAMNKPVQEDDLPAAAFPDGAFIYPGKVRPVLVVGHVHPSPSRTTRGSAKSVTKPVFSVAPYYGADPDSSRAGFPHEFISRIRQAQYAQFFWDHLPSGLPYVGKSECTSVLRMDQVFPIYRTRDQDTAAWAPTGWTLSEQARSVVEEWLLWQIRGGIPADGIIHTFRTILKEMEGEQPA